MKKNSQTTEKRYNYLHSGIEAEYHEASLKFDISDSVLKILYTVSTMGNACLLSDLCRYSGLRKQTVNSAIRKLESDGMIYLYGVDGKSKKVCLMEKGRVFADSTVLRLIKVEEDILKSWPEDDAKKFLELTERYLNSLKEKVEQL